MRSVVCRLLRWLAGSVERPLALSNPPTAKELRRYKAALLADRQAHNRRRLSTAAEWAWLRSPEGRAFTAGLPSLGPVEVPAREAVTSPP